MTEKAKVYLVAALADVLHDNGMSKTKAGKSIMSTISTAKIMFPPLEDTFDENFINGLLEQAFSIAAERPPKAAKPLTSTEKMAKASSITEEDEKYAKTFASKFTDMALRVLKEYKAHFAAVPGGDTVPFNSRHTAGLNGVREKIETLVLCRIIR